MLPLRFLFAAVFMVSLPFGLCNSESDPDVSQQDAALKAVLSLTGQDQGTLPAVGQNYACTLIVSLQPTPPTSPFHDVDGTCNWVVEQQGNVWFVGFTETWFCDDWDATVPDYPACEPPIGLHEWQYQVDLGRGTVQQIANKGPYAPNQY